MSTQVYFEKLDRLETLFGHKVAEPPSRTERLEAFVTSALGTVRGLGAGRHAGVRTAGHTSATSPS
jgi:hypothetical protein